MPCAEIGLGMRQAGETEKQSVTRHGRKLHRRNRQNRDAMPVRRLRQSDVVLFRAGPGQKMNALVRGVYLEMIGQTRANICSSGRGFHWMRLRTP